MDFSLVRLGDAGHEVPAALVTTNGTEQYYDLRSITAEINGDFLCADGIERVRGALDAGTLPALEGGAQLRTGAPVARPHAVVCVGMNYAAHAAESGAAPPEVPVIFMKMPNTVIGPNDPVQLSPIATEADWEVELGIIIGKPAYQLSTSEEVKDVIAGYTLANDLSERRSQIKVSGGQWSKGKNHPGFLPLGPLLKPAAEFDPSNVRLQSWVNGEARQDSNTSDLIFNVEKILLDLTQYMAFEPGDVILTGTPEGVALSGRFPFLGHGDVMELSIDGLGTQRQEVTVSA